MTSATTWHSAVAQEGTSRVGYGSVPPGTSTVPNATGVSPVPPSAYSGGYRQTGYLPPLDAGYNFDRPMPPSLPPVYDTLNNARRDSFGPRFDMGTFLNDRLGVEGGDVNFNVLVPYMAGDTLILFADARGAVTYDGRGALSAGVGYRYFSEDNNRLWGLSGWCDLDDGHSRTFTQAGVSFESLGVYTDVRINGYLPFNKTNQVVSQSFVGNPFFGGNHLLVNQRTALESALHGFDAEIGGPVPLLGRYGISGYVGGYWLDSDTDDAIYGRRVRFDANVTDSFRVGVNVTNDDTFGTNAWVNFNMTLPDGRQRRWFRPTAVEDRMLSTVNRSYRVQTHTRVDVTPTPVRLAGPGGREVAAVFVDPDRLINGDGSFERPFNTLQSFTNVPSNVLIIVDGSEAGAMVRVNGQAGGVRLFDDQKLLSTFALAGGGITLNTNLGNIVLPAINFGDPTPNAPTMFSPVGGTLVTLAGNNTEVAGFTFEGATGSLAIPNSTVIAGSSISNFNIHHNTFQNYRNGIDLTNATGLGFVQANTFAGLSGVSLDGVRLLNNLPDTTLNLFMDRYSRPDVTPVIQPATATATAVPTTITPLAETANNISGNDGAGVRITARNRATVNAHIVDNTISDNGDGIVMEAMSGRAVINAGIAGNTIDGNRGEDRNGNGVLDPGEDLNGDGLLDAGRGIVLTADVTSTINAATLGEDMNANGRLDLSEDLNRNGVLDTEDRNGNGVLDPSEDVNGNGILDAGEDLDGDGMLDLAEDANGNGILDTEDANGNGVLDQSEDTNGNGLLDGGYLITGNTITNNTGDGIAIFNRNLSNINLLMTRNNIGELVTASGNGGRGLSITADSGFVNANIGFLQHEDLNFDGVLATEDTNGNGVLDFGEDTNGNGVLDLLEDTNGNGVLDLANPLDGNNFVGNLGGGVLVDLSGTAVGNIQAFNNNVLGTNGGSLTFSVTGNPLQTPYTLVNNSPRGVFLNQFQLDVTTSAAGLTLDPATQDFTATAGNQTATGLFSVNGSTATPFMVPTGATQLDLSFNNFNSKNGLLDRNEDANGNGLLDAGEDTNGNGRLDLLVEDTNSNGLLDAGEDLNKQFPFSIAIAAGGAPASGDQLIDSTVSAIFSTVGSPTATTPTQTLSGTMVATLGDPTGATINLSPGVNVASGTGIELRASGAAAFNNTRLVGNDVRWYGVSGITARAIEDGQFNNLQIRNNTIDTNTSGINLNTQFAATANINATVAGNLIRNNTDAGFTALADSGVIRVREIDSNTVTGNNDGIVLNTVNNGEIGARITNNTVSDNLNDGVAAIANTGRITLSQFSDNTITGSGANGLRLEGQNNSGASLGGTIQIANSEDVNNNGLLDLGEDVNGNGLLDLGMVSRTEDANNNGMLDAGEDLNGNGRLDLGNVFAGNVDNAIFVTGTGTFDLGTIGGATILSEGAGITVDVTDSVLTGRFIGNAIDGSSVSATGTNGPGFSLTATNGTFNVVLGGPLASDRNTFTNNAGAGIAIMAQGAAVGTYYIENNLITGTADDADALTPYNGHGIYVGTRTSGLMAATATLNNGTILNNTIGDETDPTLGTIAGGILVQTGQRSTVNGMNIEGNLIANSGQTTTLLDSFDNELAGITFDRTGDGTLNNITVLNNRIVNNVFDGIYLHAQGGNLDQLDFTIQGNTISGNNTILAADPTNALSGTAGIHLRTEGDALLQTDITNNVIENNRNGIRLSSFEAASNTDLESQTGTWTKNTIRNNTEHGITIFAVTGQTNANPLINQNPLRIGLDGVDPADGRSLGNLITGNGQGGIEINLGGNIEIVNNTITFNGATPGTDANGTGGIDINLLGGGTQTDDSMPLNAAIFRNIIQDNTGDGLEVVVANGQSGLGQQATLTVLGNSIVRNSARGIDVLNQGDGNLVMTIGDLSFTGGNFISENGQEGIYVVNTSALTQSQQNGATTALTSVATVAAPVILIDVRGNNITSNNYIGFPGTPNIISSASGVYLRSGNSTGGDMVARISDNIFSANNGDDIRLETFISNTNAAATAAPLGLVLQNNVGTSIDANSGIIQTGVGSNARIELPFNNNFFQTIADPNTIFTTPPWTTVAPGTFTPLFP